MWEYNYTDEMYHHGILGMRWGIRRYQNKDGTLTPAGRKRYLNSWDGRLNERGKKELFRAKEDRMFADQYEEILKGAYEKAYDLVLKEKRASVDEFHDFDEASIKKFKKVLAKTYNQDLSDFLKNNEMTLEGRRFVEKNLFR